MNEMIRRPRYIRRYIPSMKNLQSPTPEKKEKIPYNDPYYTRSKLGGLEPFFNPDAHWPLCQSCARPQTFVGQINLADGGVPRPIREKLAEHGGEGIFQIFYCPSDYLTRPQCTTTEKLRTFFVTPKPTTHHLLKSLTNLTAHRIAKEIIQETPAATLTTHQLLIELPNHLQTTIKNIILQDRAEKAASKQRGYCIDALKSKKDFLEFSHRHFDPNATSKGTMSEVPNADKEKNKPLWEEWEIENWGFINDDSPLFSPQETFHKWESLVSQPDETEIDFYDYWILDDTPLVDSLPANIEESEDDDNGHIVSFLGWPFWNPMTAGNYPICPTNEEHGDCYEMIFVTHVVGAFDPSLVNDGGWFMLLKCSKCSSFGVTLENPCLH